MVIYSGFSSRKQEDKYNGLIKQLLSALSQMIITYLQSSTLQPFRHHYQHLFLEFTRMDAVKYSDFKVSMELTPLTDHICNQAQWQSQPPPKRKAQRKWKAKGPYANYSNTMQLTSTHNDIQNSKTQMHAKTTQIKNFRRRSLSITIDKHSDKQIQNSRYTDMKQQAERHADSRRQPTMQQLMQMNPLFDKANRHTPQLPHRRRFLKQRQKAGSQAILQQDQFEMQPDD